METFIFQSRNNQGRIKMIETHSMWDAYEILEERLENKKMVIEGKVVSETADDYFYLCKM